MTNPISARLLVVASVKMKQTREYTVAAAKDGAACIEAQAADIERLTAALEGGRAAKRKQISVISKIAGQLKDRAEKAEAALEAARAAKVKPLDWDRIDQETLGAATTIGTNYTVWEIDGYGYAHMPGTPAGERYPGGLEGAKAAAQADHEARILACIEKEGDV